MKDKKARWRNVYVYTLNNNNNKKNKNDIYIKSLEVPISQVDKRLK